MGTTQRAFRLEKTSCPRCGATVAAKTLAAKHVCSDLRAPRKKRQRAAPESEALKSAAMQGAARAFERRLERLGLLAAEPCCREEGPFDAIPVGDSASSSTISNISCEDW
eukprot:8355300-Alexandrium_andersonii.AAC.1